MIVEPCNDPDSDSALSLSSDLLGYHSAAILSVQSLTAEVCRKSLSAFTVRAFPIIEPFREFSWNWHLDEWCQVLELASAGDPAYKRITVNCPPGPLRFDTLVNTSKGPKQLCEIQVGDLVLTHTGRYKPVTEIYEQGILPILEIETDCGRVIHSAYSHRFLTPVGWVSADKLEIDQPLAVVHPIEDISIDTITDEEARFLGYLVGDGSVTHQCAMFCNVDRSILDDFTRCARAIGFNTSESRRGKHFVVRVLGGACVREYLEKFDLQGQSSYTKRIPRAVMESSKRILAAFIGAYWSCDGNFDVRVTRDRGSIYRTSATTVSKTLALDVLSALARLGIRSRVRIKDRPLETKIQPGGLYRYHIVDVQAETETGKFAEFDSLCPRKRVEAAKCRRDFQNVITADKVLCTSAMPPARCMCLTVEGDHSFTACDVAVENCMKSLLFNVMFNCWEWTSWPWLRYLTFSYSDKNTIRDNLKVQRIVTSEWYQRTFTIYDDAERAEVPIVRLADSQNTKVRFDTTALGWRIASSVSGQGTGDHPHRIVIDDSLKAQDSRSEAAVDEVNYWMDNTVSTRTNLDPLFLNIGQRLVMNDLTGHLDEKGGWQKISFPMRYETARPPYDPVTGLGDRSEPLGYQPDPRDHRTEPGELLWPAVRTADIVALEEVMLGEFGIAGQHRQNPVPIGGGLIKRHELYVIDELPSNVRLRWARGWDIADTAIDSKNAKKSDWTVGVKIAIDDVSGIVYVVHAIRRKLDPAGVNSLILLTANEDGKQCRVAEGEGSGKATVQARGKALMGYDYEVMPEREDKLTRGAPFRVQCTLGNVRVLRGDWNDAYIDCMTSFPVGKHDDDWDATANAFNRLTGMKAGDGKGTWGKDSRAKGDGVRSIEVGLHLVCGNAGKVLYDANSGLCSCTGCVRKWTRQQWTMECELGRVKETSPLS